MSKRQSKFLTGVVIGTLLGGMYSMMFAQKKGSTLRKELKDAHKQGGAKLYELLIHELSSTGKESVAVMKELLESENFQQFLLTSREKIDELMKIAKKKGGLYQKDVQKKLEHLAKLAQEKAHELGDAARDKGEELLEKGKDGFEQVQKKVQKATKNTVADFKKKIINR